MQYRAAEAIAREVESLVVETGVGEIVLAGPDASEHPDLVPLLEQLNRRFEGHDVQIRLEAVSLGSLSPAMARELHKGSRHQLVFAPVAPSERLRRVAGRPLTREAFLERAELARRGGWGTVQFQIEVGRPGETPDDLDEAAQTLEAVRAQQTRSGSAPRMSVTLVPFVPSAEDEPGSVSAAERLTEVAEAWRQRWRSRRIRVGTAPALPGLARAAFRNATSPEHLMDALQSLAPKALADLEVLEPQAWLACLRAAGVSVPAAPDRPHPVLDWNESGIPSGGTGFDSRQPETEPTEAPAELGPPAWMVGRRPRRTGRGRGTRQSERYRVRFSKSDSLRLSAHLDITRAFDRAFRRTQLPVAQTQGKDRKPKVSFGPPLPLGMTSAAEYFDITFSREVPESYVRILNEALPEGLSVVASAPVRTEPKSLNAAIQIADYEVSFSDSLIRDHLDGMDFDSLKDRLAQAAAGALAANTLEVTKVRGETSKTFNARPFLLKADVVRDDGGRPVLGLRLTLNLPDSVRPETLTARLCSWADFDERLLRVHRAGLYIPGRQKLLDPLEVVAPDFAWWRHPVRGGTVL